MKNQIYLNLPTISYFFIILSLFIYYHAKSKKSNGGHRIKKIFLFLLGIISLVDVSTIIYNRRITSDPNLTYSSHFGGTSYFPTINGTSLHIRCFNDNSNGNFNGNITILFEAGTPFYSTVWGNVVSLLKSSALSQHQNTIKQFCIYDRYGYGWSDLKVNRGVDGVTAVNDLKQYLSQIGINHNLLLVGWSYGGTLTQLFAYQHPDLVQGLVLVDSMVIEDLSDTYLISGISQGITSFTVLKYLLPTGITRFLTPFYPLESGYFENKKQNSTVVLNRTLKSSTDSIYLTYSNIDASANELSIIMDTISQQNSIIINHSNQYSDTQYLGNTPLVVLTAIDNGTPDWVQMQSNITNYSSNSKQNFATNSNHFIPLENPLSIVDSIYDCLNLINK
ncbi:hypothetical protein DICPUDRAFT_155059 [Dictyostelium purpureum]|uniref:AB hydrolase-1 domain-containing protein n=1 Tax=Dictyostelium purpureum TaxID=5786 RepID=F0ZSZ4_DICPU|nr:uncharacterized protein DICPUDRAFT_155059 [Dictyostelium purpureum]EGC32938.1 hypothetical protein DICPUDRAFT_155059 [Dictyostelium purpureum]|eukprot:XP_003290546.1 hypothetical protein DICPUDRAFT_155059 [Dictyostelium purpureum]